MNMGKLDGKVVLLTGASAGIGKQVAIRMAAEGAKLAICARRAEKLNETKALCEAKGAEVLALACDITQKDQLENLVHETVARFGGIDVLVNNTMSGTAGVPFLNQTWDHMNQILNSNLFSVWTLMQLCYPYLKASGKGSIINVGSGAAQLGLPNSSSYAAIKGAVAALTKVVANEWGVDGIRANILNPAAYTDTIKAGLTEVPEEMKEQF